MTETKSDLEIRIRNLDITIENLKEAIENKEKYLKDLSLEIDILNSQISYFVTDPDYVNASREMAIRKVEK